jgi:hypothetical protein
MLRKAIEAEVVADAAAKDVAAKDVAAKDVAAKDVVVGLDDAKLAVQRG